MAKVPVERAEGSKRVLIFDAKLERASSGRSVSGLVVIHYGSWDDEVQQRVKNTLSTGKYRLVVQRKTKGRWAHVSSEEISVTLAPS